MKAWEILRKTSEMPDFETIKVNPDALKVFYQAMGAYIVNGSYGAGAHGFWYELGDGEGHNDPEALVVTLGQRIHQLGNLYNGEGPQSPIEHLLAPALLWVDMDWAGFPSVDFSTSPKEYLEEFGPPEDLRFFLTPQAKVGAYRLDFLMWFIWKRHVAGVAIECDGHAFHEKTKEQAARDKKRDREIVTAGFPMLRFTGSEIFKDPIGCAEQVRDALSDALHRVSKDGGLFK